jgi:outer membrane protein OmpA-like peptidoglycan-associated protein
MEMKKQVLSFNEFVFEAYKVFENEKDANAFIEAVSKLDKSGISSDAKRLMGVISGIAKSTATKNNQDPEGALGSELLQFLDGITENGVKVISMESKINTIPYDNIVGGSVLMEGDSRVKLMDFIYDLNLGNAGAKGQAGAYETSRGKSYWKKVQSDRRFVGPFAMSERVGGKAGNKKRGFLGQAINWFPSFFKRETATADATKETLYLADSGLLGNDVIVSIESGVITTKTSKITTKDMFWGGKNRTGKKDRKGLSNVEGDKDVVTGYKIELPLGANLKDEQILPSKNRSSKTKKTPSVYFTLVLYSVGEVTKSDREIPFTELVKTEKTRTIGENSVEYTINMYNNDESGDPVLFDVDKAILKPTGKQNIDNAIEQFYSIDSVEILGFASQEGDVTNNKNLCVNRAKAVADYIKSVKDWNIPSSAVIASTTSNIQPAAPVATEADRKKWRKVQIKVKGTKATPVDPKKENYIDYVPTLGKFNPDKADIQQICLCFEVGSNDRSIEGK